MSGLNRWVGLGHLGADAELRHPQNGGDAMLGFRIAVTEKWRDRDGNAKEATEWVDCTIWGKRAEVLAPMLLKGKHVYVEGKLTTRSFEKDGVKHFRTGIKVTDVELLGGGEGGGSRGGGGGYAPRGGSQGDARPQGQRAQAPKQAASAPEDEGYGEGGYGGGGSDDIPFASCAPDLDLRWMVGGSRREAV